jgi:hypothetical protein
MISNRTFIESNLQTKIPLDKWFLTELLLNQKFRQKFHVINDFDDKIYQINFIYKNSM